MIRTKYIVFIKSFYFAKSWVCMLLLQKCEFLEYLKLNLTESCFWFLSRSTISILAVLTWKNESLLWEQYYRLIKTNTNFYTVFRNRSQKLNTKPMTVVSYILKAKEYWKEFCQIQISDFKSIKDLSSWKNIITDHQYRTLFL